MENPPPDAPGPVVEVAFWQTFKTRLTALRASLAPLLASTAAAAPTAPEAATATPPLSLGEKMDMIASIKTQLSQLQTFATEATPLLPPYDVRRSQEEIELLHREVKDAELTLRPKKKFTFTCRTTAKGTTTAAVPAPAPAAAAPSSSSSSSGGADDVHGSYTVASRADATIHLTAAVLAGRAPEGGADTPGGSENMPPTGAGGDVPAQLMLRDLARCVISAPTLLGCARMEDLEGCSVFLGPACTSVYLERCTDCTVVLACHQLRIHKSHRCRLYVRVNSHPIIEDCTDMGFAPYALTYPALSAHLAAAALSEARCWANVVDFRWHRATQSPHWHLLLPAGAPPAVPPALAGAGWAAAAAAWAAAAAEVGDGKALPAVPAANAKAAAAPAAAPAPAPAAADEEDEL